MPNYPWKISRFAAFLKRYRRELALAAAFFIATSLSFGLGYLAARDYNRAPIIIEKCRQLEG